MKKSILAIAYILFFSTGLFAQHGANSSVDSDKREKMWTEMTAPPWGQSNRGSASKTWSSSSAKFMAWDELHRRQYRDKGMEFFEKYPDDSRFKEWYVKTCNERPSYWKDAMSCAQNYESYLMKGTPLVCSFDDEAKNNWDLHNLVFSTRYLSDSSISEQDKKEFRISQWRNNLYYLTQKITLGQGDLGEQLKTAAPLLMAYAVAVRDYDSFSSLLDIASHDPKLEEAILAAMKLSPDDKERKTALEQEALYERLREKPVELKLPVLGKPGQTIDLAKLRGKVVLVDTWNIHCGSCIAHMPKFERLYQQFKDKGYEMVSICVIGWDGKANKEKEIVKALAIEKRMGLTYPSLELDLSYTEDGKADFDNNAIGNYLGELAGGAYYLLDKEGKSVTTDGTGQWQEYEIRRLLGLPVDQTGK